MEYVEFYVSCNPPLLPNGVLLIIEDVKKEFGEHLIEILYEPEIPWFKLISHFSNQRKISVGLHGRVEQLLQAEMGDLDKDLDDIDLEESSVQPDVEMLAGSLNAISFSSYQTISKDLLKQYDPFRYPESIKDFTHKAVWRVPEASWTTIMQLVSKYETLWPASLSEPSIETLGKLMNCGITHNMQGSVVYIGSDEGEQALSAMTRKLDVLATFMDSPSASTIHMVFNETPGPIKLCYQWLTHTGLSKLTYVDSAGSQQNREYDAIAGAVSLRTETVNIRGQPVPDRTRYPIEPKHPATWQPHFGPFAGYSYTNKRSGTTAVNENKRPLQCSQSQPLDKVSNVANPGGERGSRRDTRASITGLIGGKLDSEDLLFSPSDRQHEMPCGMRPSQKLFGSLGLSEVGSGPEDSVPLYQARQSVTRWIGGVMSDGGAESSVSCSHLVNERGEQDQEPKRATPSSPVSQPPEPLPKPKEPNLIDLGDSTPEATDSQAGQSRPSSPQIVRPPGDNLMDSFDGSINTPALLDKVLTLACSHEPEALLNVQEADSEVLFGRRDDKPKHLFETMRQQAAPGPSWASIASTKASKQEEDVRFGQNVRVTLAPDNRPTAQNSKDSGTETAHTALVTSQKTTGTGYFQDKQKQERTQTTSKSSQGTEHTHTAKTRHTVPGMDMPTMGQVDYDEIVAQAEARLHELMEIVQVAPGNISVKAEFGRLCLRGICPAFVSDGREPSWHVNQIVDTLNAENQLIGFYPILTTSGAEANLIPRAFGGRASWLLMEKRVYYEFLCVGQESAPVIVEVDADTFRHEYFPLAAEVSQAFVHCTRRAWDVKLSISRKDMEQVAVNFGEFAASLVRDMSVKTNETGEIAINVEPNSASEWSIDRVRIRHEAKYRNGAKGPSCLTITMTRIVQRVPGIPKERYRGQSVPVAAPMGGQPGQWFEASISSVEAEKKLQENDGLEFGEKTHWTPDSLKNQGVFNAICEPALRMVSQMDQVGNSNANAHDPRTDQQPYDALQDAKIRRGGTYFW